MKVEAYAVTHKNIEIRMQSRSGGIFTAVSDYVLDQGGIVYGCVMQNTLQAVHIRAVDKAMRDKMRGSKYIQSDMGGIWKDLMTDVRSGRLVLFTGTTCQVASVRKLFPEDPNNLITLDIICHGVPSPLVWEKYVQWVENKHNGNCVTVDFRNKIDFGWRAHIETLEIHRKSGKRFVSQDYFRTLFYRHNILRPACFECPYKSINRPADISIADCWGIEKAAPQMDDNKGVSLVLIESEKGRSLFESVRSDINVIEVDLANCMQRSLMAPVKRPEEREKFWRDLYTQDFLMVLKQYADYGIRYTLAKWWVKTKRSIKKRLLA